MQNYEKKLLDNGFSKKDVDKLNKIIKRNDVHDNTLQNLVIDLSKRFLGGVIGLIILFFFSVYGVLNADKSNAISYVIVLTFSFFIIYFVTPITLSWKAYRFIKKINP
ncbi:hypothetical protein CIG19_16635 [Enterobacterales bacterium CwR94]|nr:hypothetical protein CIG19_16635 [Enterobacterales bacterium CwR94]